MAKTRFRQALAAESELRKQRQGWFESIEKLANAEVRERDLLSRVDQRTQAEARAAAAMEFAVGELDRAAADLASASKSADGHRKRRRGIVRVVLSLGRAYKSWRTEHGEFVEREREAQSHAEKAAETTTTLTEISRAAADLRTCDEERLLQLRATIGSLRATLEEAKRVLGKHYPAVETWKSDDVGREKSSPWADSAWNSARARVFLEALNLHKAFVISRADVFGKNLTGLFDILQGFVPPDAVTNGASSSFSPQPSFHPESCPPGVDRLGCYGAARSQPSTATSVPSHAHDKATGLGWECNVGYVQNGRACVTLHVPVHAHLDISGHGWFCDDGFVQSGDVCVR